MTGLYTDTPYSFANNNMGPLTLYSNRFLERFEDAASHLVSLQFDSETYSGCGRRVVETASKLGLRMLRKFPLDGYMVIEFADKDDRHVASASVNASSDYPFKERKRFANVTVLGDSAAVERLYCALEEDFPQDKATKVTWFFNRPDGQTGSMLVDLKHEHTPVDEFYPWIPEGIEDFQKAYMEADANILLMLGDPGTGKTTLIRDFIKRQNRATAVTHDEGLMHKDEFFIQFMTGSQDILVLEDADVLLRPREGGNRAMSKLLNTSDGLVRSNKKIIMTANITHMDEIDTALTRPGRCFRMIKFRELSAEEAARAAAKVGVADPEGPATLGNLFAGRQRKVESRFGFAIAA